MNKFFDFFKKNSTDIIKPTAVLLAICVIIPLALSLTNKITVKKIARLEEENSKKAMAGLITADDFRTATVSDTEYYEAVKDGNIIGYIFKTSSKGYGGDVSVMTAINPDGTVKSVKTPQRKAFTRSTPVRKRVSHCLKTAPTVRKTRLTQLRELLLPQLR